MADFLGEKVTLDNGQRAVPVYPVGDTGLSARAETVAYYSPVSGLSLTTSYQAVTLTVPSAIGTTTVDSTDYQLADAGVLRLTIGGTVPTTVTVFLSADGVPITDAKDLTVIDETNGKGCAIAVNSRLPLTGTVRLHIKAASVTGTLDEAVLPLVA